MTLDPATADMPSKPHATRLAEIEFWTVPKQGTEARKQLEAYTATHKEDPKHKKLLSDTFKTATALVQVQHVNGAGLRADTQLREFNLEYNGRVFNGSLRDMPASFNVVEAYNKFRPRTATFELRAEKDHLFSFQHFIDWMTSAETAVDDLDIETQLVEGQIYSYTSIDRVSELCFSTESRQEFGIGSISMVRFGHEISLIILAGKKSDLAVETEKAKIAWSTHCPAPHRTHIQPDESLPVRAEPLTDADDLWKTIVLMRLDHLQRTVDARYVMTDMGKSYAVETDDISSFVDSEGNFIMEGAGSVYAKSSARMDEYQALFELGKTFLHLPSFFDANDEDVSVQRHPTEFKAFRTKLTNRKTVERVEPKHWIQSRDVYVLNKPVARSPDRTSFTAPKFNVETRGYWKKLPIDTKGIDRYGQPIHGRTWVTQTLSWAEERPAGITTIVSSSPYKFDGNRAGYIYVMRSAAHAKDIFKIGLTTRTTEERAKELTRSTSSPDHFLTVQEWATPDCVLAEKLIHEELARYRINPGREFFKAEYKDIVAAIQGVIVKVEAMTTG